MLAFLLSRDDIRAVLAADVLAYGERWPVYVWTVEHPQGLVLVDTGMIEPHPAVAEWDPRCYPLDSELVARVAVVVNTHLHFDHCGGNRLFPGVPIHVQARELADARADDGYTVREWVDFAGATYVEHEGEADVRRRGRKINTLHSGDFLGEIALITGAPRTATVTTTAGSRLLVITSSAFRRLMREMPSIQEKVLAALAARIPEDLGG